MYSAHTLLSIQYQIRRTKIMVYYTMVHMYCTQSYQLQIRRNRYCRSYRNNEIKMDNEICTLQKSK